MEAAAMAAITIKDVPEHLHRKLKAQAKANHRSLNREAIACLEQAVGGGRIDPNEFLAGVRELRSRIRGPAITDAWLRKAKNEGRP
jgi:plasmid stability protein